jgi:hypothetical protein
MLNYNIIVAYEFLKVNHAMNYILHEEIIYFVVMFLLM